jgi:hypothetical protein
MLAKNEKPILSLVSFMPQWGKSGDVLLAQCTAWRFCGRRHGKKVPFGTEKQPYIFFSPRLVPFVSGKRAAYSFNLFLFSRREINFSRPENIFSRRESLN